MANTPVPGKRVFAMSEQATRGLEDLVVSAAVLETHCQPRPHLHLTVSDILKDTKEFKHTHDSEIDRCSHSVRRVVWAIPNCRIMNRFRFLIL